MKKYIAYGTTLKEESAREITHREIARRAAAEGMVLLKNNGILPLNNKKIALFGAGARMTVKGGTGSGEVKERYSVNIETGLKNSGFIISNSLWMDRFDKKYDHDKEAWRAGLEQKIKGYGPFRTMKMFDIIHSSTLPFPAVSPILDDEIDKSTDTALYVITRQAGESSDRKVIKGDYLLDDVETANIKKLAKSYSNIVLIINSGGMIDLSILDEVNVGAIIYFSQGGMEGGNALADLISGKITPSGKLTDTWARDYYDYPSADTYASINGVVDHANYYEGIYVGYRYFDAKNKTALFPFGYGLSYTEFSHKVNDVLLDKTTITLKVHVKNIGKLYSGKEIIQLYIAKPEGRIDHEHKSLVAFAKTKLLSVGESEEVILSFDLSEQGVFDETSHSFILEKGEYGLLLGNSSASLTPVAVVNLSEEVTVEKVSAIHKKDQSFTDYRAVHQTISYEESLPRLTIDVKDFRLLSHEYKKPQLTTNKEVLSVLNKLSNKELINVCVGNGYKLSCPVNAPGAAGFTTTKLLKYGIPNVVLSDGPAGINVIPEITVLRNGGLRYPEGVPQNWRWGWVKHMAFLIKSRPGQGTTYYHYMSAFPCSTLLAQSWNLALLGEVGTAIGKEMREIGVSIWLAPGMNLHRNPLCGRNFEYYSEDPFVSGKMAAAITNAVQAGGGVGVSIKHFCANNQETNREHMTSNLSERALRELYLRSFRIAINESNPWTVMSSYNMVNGIYTPNSYDLLTKVLRDEWGFKGLVMSDWHATNNCSHAEALKVGNDLIMPGNKHVRNSIQKALKNGEITREDLRIAAGRVIEMILKSKTTKDYIG